MSKQFGDKYKKLIDKNPNKKSIPNNDPGLVFGVLRTKNPYISLLSKWDFIPSFVTGSMVMARGYTSAPTPPPSNIYYVYTGYVDDGYVEVQ